MRDVRAAKTFVALTIVVIEVGTAYDLLLLIIVQVSAPVISNPTRLQSKPKIYVVYMQYISADLCK